MTGYPASTFHQQDDRRPVRAQPFQLRLKHRLSPQDDSPDVQPRRGFDLV
jgi:hypothetical protein